jgi:ribosomal protein L29
MKQTEARGQTHTSEVTELRQEIARLRTEIQSRQSEPA